MLLPLLCWTLKAKLNMYLVVPEFSKASTKSHIEKKKLCWTMSSHKYLNLLAQETATNNMELEGHTSHPCKCQMLKYKLHIPHVVILFIL